LIIIILVRSDIELSTNGEKNEILDLLTEEKCSVIQLPPGCQEDPEIQENYSSMFLPQENVFSVKYFLPYFRYFKGFNQSEVRQLTNNSRSVF